MPPLIFHLRQYYILSGKENICMKLFLVVFLTFFLFSLCSSLKVTLQIFHNFLSSVDVTKLSELYTSCKHTHTCIPMPFISEETIWLFVDYLWITDTFSNIVWDTSILINFLQLKGADTKIWISDFSWKIRRSGKIRPVFL